MDKTRRHVALIVRLGMFSAIALGFTLDEVRRMMRRIEWACGLHRQAPQAVGKNRSGTLWWGIDAGLLFSTFRSTCLTWVGLTAMALGFGNVASLVAYPAGFCLTLVLLCKVKPPGRLTAVGEASWIYDRLRNRHIAMRATSIAVAMTMTLLIVAVSR